MSSALIINLALILTLLTLFTGIVVALDKMVWKTTEDDSRDAAPGTIPVSYTHLTLPTTPYV